eukprot:1139016-Pelagomonas_calceolata.AAC.1
MFIERGCRGRMALVGRKEKDNRRQRQLFIQIKEQEMSLFHAQTCICMKNASPETAPTGKCLLRGMRKGLVKIKIKVQQDKG